MVSDRLCLTDDRMVPCPVDALEAKLHGMTAAMQQWRSLTGQMTDERDRLRAALEGVWAVAACMSEDDVAVRQSVRERAAKALAWEGANRE